MSLIDSEITSLLAQKKPYEFSLNSIQSSFCKAQNPSKKGKSNSLVRPYSTEKSGSITNYIHKMYSFGSLEPELLVYSAFLVDRYLQNLTILFKIDLKAIIACSIYLANKMIHEI